MSVYASVTQGFIKAVSNEGCIPWMYLDVRGLVTTGRGNLIEPVSAALALPWTLGDGGAAASAGSIERDWTTVKNKQYLKDTLASSGVIAELTQCRLTQAAIDKLDLGKMTSMAMVLEYRWPGFRACPADAQLALLRWAWACGPEARYPRMFACLTKNDYAGAAEQAEWTNENADVRAEITKLFHNAAGVLVSGADPSQLLGP